MTRYEVVYTRRAEANLRRILAYIAKESSPRMAVAFVESIRDHCESLSSFPQRGKDFGAISSGLRLVGFRKTVSIVFRTRKTTISIVAVYYRGPDVEARMKSGDST